MNRYVTGILGGLLENPELTPILRELITQSSLPLSSVETDFARCSHSWVSLLHDSFAGLTTSTAKSGNSTDWVKCHLMCGVKTNIVTAVEIEGRHAADDPVFRQGQTASV